MTKAKSVTLSFTINASMDPSMRGEHFEDPLYNWLAANGAQILDGGGGTMLHGDGRGVSDFFVSFTGRSNIPGAIQFIKSLGVPIGSAYRIDNGDETSFGDCRSVRFSIKKPPRFGPKQIEKLTASVKNAVQSTGKLLAAHATNGRLFFHVFGNDAPGIHLSMGPLLKDYSKHDPRVESAA